MTKHLPISDVKRKASRTSKGSRSSKKPETLKEKIRRHLKEIAPYFLHLGIVVAVTIYVLAGAFAIREIEAVGPEEQAARPPVKTSPVVAEVSRMRREAEARQPLVFQQQRLFNMNRTRRCVISALHRIRQLSNCTPEAVDSMQFDFLDSCYEHDLKQKMKDAGQEDVEIQVVQSKGSDAPDKLKMSEDGWKRWSITDSILFCFTVITTIGYGNVAPRTFNGRLFVIFYGLIGVPFTMLAIANLGKFLAALLKSWTRPFIKCFGKLRRRCFRSSSSPRERQSLMKHNNNKPSMETSGDGIESDEEEEEEEVKDDGDSSSDAFVLFVSFIIYVVVGSLVISRYEPDMEFFEAIYFNFVTLTTIGLGDLVPQSDTFLLATLIYCAVGLALTTIAIEIAADTLKKIHYFGRKIENVGNVKVWFGGQQISMKQLVKNLGDQFNVPVDQLKDLNLEQFVDDAMKVEAGELATLRKEPEPYMTSNYWQALEGGGLHFVDDDDVIAMQANRNYYNDYTDYPFTLPPDF